MFLYWNAYQLFTPQLGDAVLVIKQGQSIPSATAEAPGRHNPDWQTVTLPDNWGHNRRGYGGQVWYRFEAELATRPATPWALYLPRISQNAALYINGVFVGDGGSMTPPYALNWRRPLMFDVSSALLKSGKNTIDLAVVGYANSDAGLSAVYLGPRTHIKPQYDHQFRTQVAVSFVSLLVLIGMTLASAWLWLLRRQDPVYHSFFLVCLVGVVWVYATFTNHNYNFHLFHWAYLVCAGWFVFGLLRLANRLVGRRWGLDEKFFMIYALVGAIVVVLSPTKHQQLIGHIWHLGSIVQGLLIFRVLWTGRKYDPGFSVISLMMVMSLGFVLGVNDIIVKAFNYEHVAPVVFNIGPLMLVMVLGTDLIGRFVRSLEQSEKLNQELHQRVEEKRLELERTYRNLGKLEKQQAVYAERERIMRDLHDGLGGHLMTALAYSEKDNGSPLLRDTLGQALNEMRLMIDTVDIDPASFITLVASMRERIEPLLERQGGSFTWNLHAEPDTGRFGRTEILHLLRIIQESFTNILKHAHASEVVVEFNTHSITIRDNGKGFDHNSQQTGRGLGNMRKRAEAANIDLHIKSSASGTSIFLQLRPANSQS